MSYTIDERNPERQQLLADADGRSAACSSVMPSRQLRNSRVLSRRISVSGAIRGSMGDYLSANS